MFSLLCHLLSAFVGAVLPVFYSYKTIKKPSQKMLSYWSKYWAVFGSFLAVDAVLDSLFIHYFVPFYEFGKLMFLIWAVNPYTAGAQFVFDKILAPFIKRHEKEMDIYVECMIDGVVTRGPELAITHNTASLEFAQNERCFTKWVMKLDMKRTPVLTQSKLCMPSKLSTVGEKRVAGSTLWNAARNLHALSRMRTDTLGRALLQGEQRITIAEILTDQEEEEAELNALEAAPVIAEVKAEEPESDDEVIFVDPHQHMDRTMTSKSSASASSKTPLPTKRRRGRRPSSNVTRKKNNRNAKRANSGELAFETFEDDMPKRPMRRSNRVASVASKKQLVIVGDDMTGEE
ncbi:hypothetical protein RB195_015324 [Necator americanus]|uniref:Receptor expression-enhancing protein n=1 Tax=Necator americanus TaxID=51031 RepID=A0ABR1E408_NECAM